MFKLSHGVDIIAWFRYTPPPQYNHPIPSEYMFVVCLRQIEMSPLIEDRNSLYLSVAEHFNNSTGYVERHVYPILSGE